MGHQDSALPQRQRQGHRREHQQRRQQKNSRRYYTLIIIAILSIIFLCYTRSSSHQPSPSVSPTSPPVNMASTLTTPTLIFPFPKSHLPKPHGGHSAPLIIIIGDVHGQSTALDALLSATSYSKDRGDVVIFAGDMVNKGPDSPGVVSRAMEMGAWGVRGNNEDRVLSAWARYLSSSPGSKTRAEKEAAEVGVEGKGEIKDTPKEDKSEEGTGETEIDEAKAKAKAEKEKRSKAADLATATSLTAAQISWLANLPVILHLGHISPYYGDVLVAHAGLVPNVPLEEQDAWAVMNMRTLVPYSHSSPNQPLKPLEGRDGRPWSEAWDELQREKRGNKTTIVYGHDAMMGLTIRRYTFGLDSNCARGFSLSALVFEPTSPSTSFSSTPPSADGRALDISEEEKRKAAEYGIVHKVVSVPCGSGDSEKEGKKDKKKDKAKNEEEK
ncbi:Metallo-dependent phosphatase [Hypoxylon trugodes]|uniref:Metallo-dependent phosphatase n=1 Tax=Hypoxylon trugodes TaxID=326681 RepID=UPI00218E2E06|nr:Metallo-dependent phosphatase [Hypoxylon trugodes]KAI1392145.1 Metallo-dependent phosphatase [Hypoxylon trugodes]